MLTLSLAPYMLLVFTGGLGEWLKPKGKGGLTVTNKKDEQTGLKSMQPAQRTSTPVFKADKRRSARVVAARQEDTIVKLIADDKRSTLFNANWKMRMGSADGSDPNLDDSKWQILDLPDDYSIIQPFSDKNEAESGYLGGGSAWYRKEFTVGEEYQGKRITMNFDGVYMNAEIYVNGKRIATHPNGYAPFTVDLSQHLNYGDSTQNIVAIKTNNEVPSSRWYSGSGIYRDVYLTVTNAVHIGDNGVVVRAPALQQQHDKQVAVHVVVVVCNRSSQNQTVMTRCQLLDADGKTVATAEGKSQVIKAGATQGFEQVIQVNQPQLWSPETPYLYAVRTQVVVNGRIVDQYDVDYGFRFYAFDRDHGLMFNGQQLKLKGVSMHHDQGALGAVANPAAVNRQVRILKEMGANAVRSTHNPASQALIEACNRYGMLLIDEGFDDWTNYKNGNVGDYAKYFDEKITADNDIAHGRVGETWAEFDVKSMVSSSRNAPSIVMWSIGNEITEGASGDFSKYPGIAGRLIAWIKAVDDSRPITIGDNRLDDQTLDRIDQMITDSGGVVGKNYKTSAQLETQRRRHPDWKLYGSETSSALHSRGEYKTTGRDNTNLQMSEYETAATKVGWGHSASDAWKFVMMHDWNAGEFVWTGFDYIGEPTPWNGVGTGSVSGQGAAPKSAYFGIVDTAGFPKDIYYLYRSVWNEKSHTLNLMSTWNNQEIAKNADGTVRVDVYTDAARVDLYLNGEKIGSQTAIKHTTNAGYSYQTFGDNSFYPTFNVQWAAGTLSARIYDADGRELTKEAVGRQSVTTSGDASQLNVSADRTRIAADGRDLSYVTVTVLDENGHPVANAGNRITFSLLGNGRIVGVDNGDPADLDSYKADNRRAFHGKALVIVQSTKDAGTFTLTASGAGLKSSSVTVQTERASTDNAASLVSYRLSRHYYAQKGTEIKLPGFAIGKYRDGSQRSLAVAWRANDLAVIQNAGEYTVHGLIASERVKIAVTVTVVNPVAGLINPAAKVEIGKTVHLPKMVGSISQDGEFGLSYVATWDDAKFDASQLGRFTIHGVADVFGDVMNVSALVTVVPSLGAASNIAVDKNDRPLLTNGYQDVNGRIVDAGDESTGDNLAAINDGVVDGSEDACARWTNRRLRASKAPLATYVQMDWKNSHVINAVKLYHFTNHQAVVLPGDNNVHFEYWDRQMRKWAGVESSHITQVSYQSGETPYGFETPIATNKLRIWLKAPTNGTYIGLTEAQVYDYIAPLEFSHEAKLSKLSIGGLAIDLKNKQGRNTANVKDAMTIDAAAAGNGATAVVKINGNRYAVVVTAEDGETTKLYIVTRDGVIER